MLVSAVPRHDDKEWCKKCINMIFLMLLHGGLGAREEPEETLLTEFTSFS